MTKISSSSSRSANSAIARVFGLGSLFIAITGASPAPRVLSLPKIGDPWATLAASGKTSLEGFAATEPTAFAYRATLVPVEECKAEVARFAKWRVGTALGQGPSFNWSGFDPWENDDVKAIKDCTKFPCAVKLNEAETTQLRTADVSTRVKVYRSLVQKRAENYARTGARLNYQYPEAPTDPTAAFAKYGLETLPTTGERRIYARKLNFAPGKFRPIRQLLDQTTVHSGTRVTHVVRDLYSDHYFDSWGEWAEVDCADAKSLRLFQGLYMEFDLFKKRDFVSSLARPKMKSALEDQAKVFFREARTQWGWENAKSR